MILLWVVFAVMLLFGLAALFGAPYVPSLTKQVSAAFDELYAVTDKDMVVDLGSGDGLVLVEATKRGARGYGFEINPVLVIVSKLRLGKKANIRMTDMWNTDLPNATTLAYAFSVSRDTKKLGRYMQGQADRLARPLKIMTFGARLDDHEPIAELRGHTLYEIHPKRS